LKFGTGTTTEKLITVKSKQNLITPVTKKEGVMIAKAVNLKDQF